MRIKYLLLLIFECLAVVLCIKTFGQGTVLLGSGAQVKCSNGAYMVLNDMHLVNNGTIQQSLGEGIFKFTGATDVELSGSGITILNKLHLNKSSNTRLSLQCTIAVTGEINFAGGLLNLNNSIVDLGNTGVLIAESETSRAYSAGTGYLQAVATLDNPAGSNPGNLGALITSTENLGLTTIRRGHAQQTNPGDAGKSILRYYDILPSNNSSLNATLRFYYLDAELNNLNETILQLFKSSDNINWSNQGVSSRDLTQNFVEKTSISGFSRWTLAPAGSPLPVTGLSLSGYWQNNTTLLKWTTLAEYNNHYFDIERRYANENDFVSIGRKYSLHSNGNSQTSSFYQWIDSNVTANRGPVQYRLKQVDYNGQSGLSNVVVVRPDNAPLFIINVYPTVVEANNFYIRTGNLSLSQMRVQVYDMNGKLYQDRVLSYQSQWVQFPYLGAGAYRLVVTSGGCQYSAAFIKK
jgi:hypothetical protein